MKKGFKKTFVLLGTTCLLSMSIGSSVLAQDSQQSELDDFKAAKQNGYVIQNDVIDSSPLSVSQHEGLYSPSAINPGTGALRVQTTTYGSYAELQEKDKVSGLYNNIKGVSLLIITNVVAKASSVIIGATDLALSSIDTTKMATAKTLTSYSYPTKQGQAWYSGTWNTLFESTNRNTYKHYSALVWDKNKNQIQRTKDYVPSTGFSAIKVESAPHYNNNSYITQKTQENYIQGKRYSDENWLN